MPDTPEQRVSDERLHDLVNINDYEALQSHARPLAFDLFDARTRIAELEAEVSGLKEAILTAFDESRSSLGRIDGIQELGKMADYYGRRESGQKPISLRLAETERDHDALREKLAELEKVATPAEFSNALTKLVSKALPPSESKRWHRNNMIRRDLLGLMDEVERQYNALHQKLANRPSLPSYSEFGEALRIALDKFTNLFAAEREWSKELEKLVSDEQLYSAYRSTKRISEVLARIRERRGQGPGQ